MKVGALREAERMLADKQTELAKVVADLDAKSMTADSQRVELVALRAQAEALKDRVSKYERDTQEISDRLDRERTAATNTSNELNDERTKGKTLGDRVVQLERQLATQTTETEVLSRQTAELESKLSDQVRLLSERELESSQLREKIAAAQKTEGDLRAELEASAGRTRSAAEAIAKEKALIEDQLASRRRSARSCSRKSST